ncbi:FecR domain-containing protein [Pseudomonas sp. BP8]|uniref:FecR domain-containing protein n=1 Tax=Pseudomonas sp. BP8 TaxID=2817864 RepID=UPI001AE49DB8|nr:FecR domain-containing protein [Pseudomonas sp. BP8]MBP2261576.1 transmembrane sensor [Pseudomonas sp. BP8]HDS1733485.1 FecR domain-containing protein [Pseudomonas putida]
MPDVDGRILDEAAHWLARSGASDFSQAEQLALTHWRKQSARHEQVWSCAQQLRSRMSSVPGGIGMQVLTRPRTPHNRRTVLRALAFAIATPALGVFTYRYVPWQGWTADFSTAKGEQRLARLTDGSQVLLNTDTAFDARFDGHNRLVRQYKGEILVKTAHDMPESAPPFLVQTNNGQLRALGTEFIVRQHPHFTELSVLKGAVEIVPALTSQRLVVHEAQRTKFDARQIGDCVPLPVMSDAWTRGTLYADNMRLQAFLDEIARYRKGILRCDDAVADLRVFGVYQLQDTDRLLDLLTHILPVRVRRRTDYWVNVTRA